MEEGITLHLLIGTCRSIKFFFYGRLIRLRAILSTPKDSGRSHLLWHNLLTGGDEGAQAKKSWLYLVEALKASKLHARQANQVFQHNLTTDSC